jgi:hypothetical protein
MVAPATVNCKYHRTQRIPCRTVHAAKKPQQRRIGTTAETFIMSLMRTIGPVLMFTKAEIAAVRGYETRPGVAAGLEKMAEIVDNPDLATVAPEAMRELADGLQRLRDAAMTHPLVKQEG